MSNSTGGTFCFIGIKLGLNTFLVLINIQKFCFNPRKIILSLFIPKFFSITIFGTSCLLEQNVFNIITLRFDDNKVLKCQLDMLIFVQIEGEKNTRRVG
jgi:hypothetical protein